MRVLLAEDSILVRKRLIDRINQIPGVDIVGTAASRAELSAALWLYQPDALVLDIHLQDGNALDALKQYPRALPPVMVAMTAGPTVPYRRVAGQLGVARVFDKAVEIEDMAEFLAAADALGAVGEKLRLNKL